MEAEIIAVGSELLTPARLDTNSLFLTQKLNERGVEVVRKTIIGDDRVRLTAQIVQAFASAEILIITGGLGPTLDDLTREAASDALGVELEFHASILDEIAERFRRFGRPMAENNHRQAYILKGGEALPNPNGTAPGQFFTRDGKYLMMLPGPPRELKPMFENECLPRLASVRSAYEYYTVSLRIAGMGESDVDHRVGPIYSAEQRVATTILAAPGDVQLHLRGRASKREEAQSIAEALAEKVVAELGDHVFSRQNESIEQVVKRLFIEKRIALAAAESCTGGLLAEKITDVPGASGFFTGSVVSYHSQAKVEWLGVAGELIRKHGPVSEETAKAMAESARRMAEQVCQDARKEGERDGVAACRQAVGLSITGVAGPSGGTEQAPVGTVFLGLATNEGVEAKHLRFGSDRDRVRLLAAQIALDWLRRFAEKA